MILRILQVAGFRCFRDTYVLQDLDPTFNLILGPNESGKSTLFLALHHAFFTPYRTTGADLEQLRPWGTSLAPSLRVEFETEGQRYRVEKQLLTNPACRLSEWRSDRYEALADGDVADNRVRAMLLGEKPARGAARAENRGMARLLWAPQNEDLGPPTVTDATLNRIQAALCRMTSDTGEATLAERVESMYLKVFTPARANYRKGSEVVQHSAEVERLKAELAALREQHAATETNAAALGTQEADLRHLQAERSNLQSEADGLRADIERVQGLRRKLQLAEAEHRRLQELFERIDGDRVRLQKARLTLEEQRKTAQQATVTLREIDDRRIGLEADERGLAGDLQQVRADLDRLEQERRRASRIKDARTAGLAMEQLQKTLDEVQRLTAKKAEQAQVLAALTVPEEADVLAARDQANRLRELDGQLKSAGLSVAVRLEVPLQVTFEGSEGAQVDALTTRAERYYTSADHAVVRLAGIGTVEIRSGAGEIRQLQKTRAEIETGLSRLLDRFGITTVEELAQLRSRGDELHRELTNLDGQSRAALGVWKTVPRLQQEHARWLGELETLARALDVAATDVVQLEVPDLEALQQELDVHIGRVRRLEQEQSQQIEKARDADRRRGEYLAVQTAAETTCQAAQQLIDELLSVHGEEAAIERAYQGARRERQAAQETVKDLTGQIPPPGADPEAKAKRLQEQGGQLDVQIRACQDGIVRLQTLLDNAAAQGLYGLMAAKEEALQLATVRHASAEREARAIAMVHTLIDLRRKAVAATLAAPISDRVAHLLTQVTTHNGRRPVFDDHLAFQGMIMGTGEPRPRETLSGGTQEQLFLLTRLALAQYLAQSERQLFVLDDTLLHTDAERLDRFVALLQEASAALQVVVLSCHPERYQALRAAKRYPLNRRL